MKTEINLIPCPFCGGPAILFKGGFGDIFGTCADEKQCGGRLGTSVWFTSEEQAAAIWNMRNWKNDESGY